MARKKTEKKSFWLTLLFVILLLFGVFLLLPAYHKYRDAGRNEAKARERELQLKSELTDLQKENRDLRESPEAVEKVGREVFGLTKPGETIMKYDTGSDNDK